MKLEEIANRHEIEFRTIRLIVGLVAISLAGLTSLFAKTPLSSISASYYEGGWSQSIFIGFLFAIAAFMIAYNGRTRTQFVLSKVAAVAALTIALFPCSCGHHPVGKVNIHGIAGVTMFLDLTCFCYIFLRRALEKGHARAKARVVIYVICGVVMTASILVEVIDHFMGGTISAQIPRLTFYCETFSLIGFGVSWLTASRILPLLTAPHERYSPLKAINPD
jgi:hypothetical protein